VLVVSYVEVGTSPIVGIISTYSSRILSVCCAPTLSYCVPSGSGMIILGATVTSAMGQTDDRTNAAPWLV
jgi:hypothetical protein